VQDLAVFIEDQDIVPGIVRGHENTTRLVHHHFMAVFDRVAARIAGTPVQVDPVPEIAVADEGLARSFGAAKDLKQGLRRNGGSGRQCKQAFTKIRAVHRFSEKAFQNSAYDIVYDLPGNIGQPETASLAEKHEFFMVDAEQMQQGRLQVVYVY